jgi:ribose transport system permease protein
MSTATSSPAAPQPEASTAGRTLPLTEGSLPQRIVRGALTPGGAVFILLAVLFIAVVWVNPSFGEPPQLIRFIGRTAPIAIAAICQY